MYLRQIIVIPGNPRTGLERDDTSEDSSRKRVDHFGSIPMSDSVVRGPRPNTSPTLRSDQFNPSVTGSSNSQILGSLALKSTWDGPCTRVLWTVSDPWRTTRHVSPLQP